MEIRRKTIFHTVEDLIRNQFLLFGLDIFCTFDIETIPNNVILQLKLQNNQVFKSWRIYGKQI